MAFVALGSGGIAQAALAITNGDFSVAPSSDNQADITGWYDYDSGNFWEQSWLESGDTPFGPALAMAGGGFLGRAWAYQAIGTADGASTLTVRFDYGSFADATVNRDLGVSWSVYAVTGAFVPGQNVDVSGAAGVTLLDTVAVSSLAVAPGGNAGTATVALNLSAAAGSQLYLRVSNFSPTTNANDNGYLWVDNVALVPEPSVALLAGLAGMGALRRRRC